MKLFKKVLFKIQNTPLYKNKGVFKVSNTIIILSLNFK